MSPRSLAAATGEPYPAPRSLDSAQTEPRRWSENEVRLPPTHRLCPRGSLQSAAPSPRHSSCAEAALVRRVHRRGWTQTIADHHHWFRFQCLHWTPPLPAPAACRNTLQYLTRSHHDIDLLHFLAWATMRRGGQTNLMSLMVSSPPPARARAQHTPDTHRHTANCPPFLHVLPFSLPPPCFGRKEAASVAKRIDPSAPSYRATLGSSNLSPTHHTPRPMPRPAHRWPSPSAPFRRPLPRRTPPCPRRW